MAPRGAIFFCETSGNESFFPRPLWEYFRMQKLGTGPATMRLRNGTRISTEAGAAWRRAREVASRERRREH
jgi:hypothetical protein